MAAYKIRNKYSDGAAAKKGLILRQLILIEGERTCFYFQMRSICSIAEE